VVNISELDKMNGMLIWNYISTICCYKNERIVLS